MSQSRPTLVLIAAVARNGVIGRNGQLPWHIPQDLQHLKRLTIGWPVIMGRRTWDSLPPRFRPLPGRVNIVVTRQPGWQAAGAVAVASLQAAIDQATALAAGPGRVFVIGGAELYAQALSRADVLELTEIQQEVDGDVHFPTWRREDFVEQRREHHASASPGQPAFDFVTYHRKRT